MIELWGFESTAVIREDRVGEMQIANTPANTPATTPAPAPSTTGTQTALADAQRRSDEADGALTVARQALRMLPSTASAEQRQAAQNEIDRAMTEVTEARRNLESVRGPAASTAAPTGSTSTTPTTNPDLESNITRLSRVNTNASMSNGEVRRAYREAREGLENLRLRAPDPEKARINEAIQRLDAHERDALAEVAEERQSSAQRSVGIASVISASGQALANMTNAAGNVTLAARSNNNVSPYGSIGFPGGFGGVGFGGGFGQGLGFGEFGGGLDLSNNLFGIQSQGGDIRSKSRALTAKINQLLAAIQNGNLDAITSALTLCSLQSKHTMAQSALHMVTAMQSYDRQMEGVTDQMQALSQNTHDSSNGASLARLNGQMNQFSMMRQALMSSMRDVQTMSEEIETANKSVQDARSREPMNYRWS